MTWPLESVVVRVQNGQEDSVLKRLGERIVVAGLRDHFGALERAHEKVTEIKAGRRRIVGDGNIPGYLLLQMTMEHRAWSLVRQTPGVESVELA